MGGKNPWMDHLAKVWAVEKKKGTSYKKCMTIAKQSYRKGQAAGKVAAKKGGKRKKKA